LIIALSLAPKDNVTKPKLGIKRLMEGVIWAQGLRTYPKAVDTLSIDSDKLSLQKQVVELTEKSREGDVRQR
jgi:hypothetical protein